MSFQQGVCNSLVRLDSHIMAAVIDECMVLQVTCWSNYPEWFHQWNRFPWHRTETTDLWHVPPVLSHGLGIQQFNYVIMKNWRGRGGSITSYGKPEFQFSELFVYRYAHM